MRSKLVPTGLLLISAAAVAGGIDVFIDPFEHHEGINVVSTSGDVGAIGIETGDTEHVDDFAYLALASLGSILTLVGAHRESVNR